MANGLLRIVARVSGMTGLILGWSLKDVCYNQYITDCLLRMLSEVGGMSGLLLGWSLMDIC